MAQAKPLTKIRLATSTAGLDFAPIWIAQRKGYFKEDGIDFEHILTTGGAVTMAAVMNGDVQFVSTAASDVLVARSRGDRMFSVGIFPASLEWHIASNNQWLERTNHLGQGAAQKALCRVVSVFRFCEEPVETHTELLSNG
jgi:hypothetical protein